MPSKVTLQPSSLANTAFLLGAVSVNLLSLVIWSYPSTVHLDLRIIVTYEAVFGWIHSRVSARFVVMRPVMITSLILDVTMTKCELEPQLDKTHH